MAGGDNKDEDHHYHPKDAIKGAIQDSMVTGIAGVFFSAAQNTLTKKNVGVWGVFTRTGSTIAVMTVMGAGFGFTKNAAANLREKDDYLNHAIGGFVGGAVLGLRHRTTPAVLGFGLLTSVVLGAFEFTGGRLNGLKKDPDLDEFERKEHLRKNRRIPIDETIAQIGEGRGIYPPGYDERRKERIKANYGIDVPAKSTHS